MRHVLLDLIHYLNRFQCIPCLKVIPLLLRRVVSPKHHHPEALRMPATHLAPHHVVEADRPRLRIRHRLARIRRHDVHVVVVERQGPVIRGRERHRLLAEHMVASVVAPDEVGFLV